MMPSQKVPTVVSRSTAFTGKGNPQRSGLGGRFADVHLLQDEQVVVQRHDAVQGGNNDEPEVAALHGRGKEVQLSDEPAQRRYAGQREEGEREDKGEHRIAAGKPGVVLETVRTGSRGEGDDC